MHSSVKNTRFKIIKYAVLIEVFAAAVLIGLHYLQPGMRVASKFLGTKAYAQPGSCEWTGWMGVSDPMKECGGVAESHDFFGPLECPAGNFLSGIQIKKCRCADGDRDWYDFKLYCCPEYLH